jgi:iron complex transport system ATP-binding protein
VLSEGQVAAAGPPEEAITPAVLADVWRVRARIDHCERGSLRMVIDDIL